MNSDEKQKTYLNRLIESISDELDEYEEKRFPKAVIYSKKRQSVEFSLPEPYSRIALEFREGKAPEVNNKPFEVPRGGTYSDSIVCFVPFKVERLGANKFIAMK